MAPEGLITKDPKRETEENGHYMVISVAGLELIICEHHPCSISSSEGNKMIGNSRQQSQKGGGRKRNMPRLAW